MPRDLDDALVSSDPGATLLLVSAHKPKPAIAEVEAWLGKRHAAPVAELTPLAGGLWSSAYSYRAGDDELVLRLGDAGDGYRIDAAATRFAGPGLPVPEVLEVGRAFEGAFAISRRHHGRFIETVPEADAEGVGEAMAGLLRALRAVPGRPAENVEWYRDDGSGAPTWRDWLLGGITDHPTAVTAGWRAKLASDAPMDALFRNCETRIRELLPACPERRDLVHGDLLHQNVLVAEDDPARVTAVFSWKCSARGDFLYDVAWCTVWSPWHPAIAGAQLWARTLDAPDLGEAELAGAALRHHCYELQIAASHMGWYAWTNDDPNQSRLAEVAQRILERGPLFATVRRRSTRPMLARDDL